MPVRLRDRIELIGQRMKSFDRAPAADVERHTLDRLRRLIDWHVNQSSNPAYRHLLEQSRVRLPIRLERLEDLSLLPVVEKSFLAASGYATQPATGAQRVTTVETSGTTSSVVRIPHTSASIQAGLGDSFLRCLAAADLDSTSRYWTIGHRAYPRQATGSYLSFEWLARVASNTLISNTTDILEVELLRAAALDPDCVASAPGFLTRLANHLLDSNDTRLQPSVVLYGGAAMPDEDRRAIKEAMGCPRIVAFYPTTDAGPIAWSAEDDGLYATFAETHVVEILDSDGAPVAQGSSGRLVVSVLDNRAAPMIRYATGDEVTLVGRIGNRLVLSGIRRVAEVSIGDGLLSIGEIEGWVTRLTDLGFPVNGVQMVIRTGPTGLDQPIIRVFADDLEQQAAASDSHQQIRHCLASGALHTAVVEILASNWQMRSVGDSATIEAPKVEILPRPDRDNEGWKMKPVIDERVPSLRGTRS